MAVRVRMAPSPTGYFHVGNARTALYNWFFARQQGGTYILRIEDTDAERHQEEVVEVIRAGMRWLGLDWDEEHRQSERSALYTAAADQLEASGHAYWCECTREEVDARVKTRGGPPGYDGFCRDRGLRRAEGRALRFRAPEDGATVVHDIVRGDPVFENRTIEDFVIQRANGSALFLLANVVDDGDMRITHVIRGEDHLPNTPKYLLLWDALGYGDHPVFAHTPMMVNEKRQKLSKRRNDPVELERYRDEGYLPAVMANYLALVGWSPGDGREQMSIEEMVEAFRLEDVSSSPGFFDVKKLRAFNGDAIRAMDVDELVAAVEPFALQLPWADSFDLDRFRTVAPLVQTRVEVLSEAAPMVDFLFLDEPIVDEVSWAKVMTGDAASVLDAVAMAWESIDWKSEIIGETTLGVGEELGLSKTKSQAPVRVAITGRTVGPPLWETLELLGREGALERLRAARARLG